MAGRRIAWKQIDDRRQLLEELLQTPYDELFDPKYGGPLYLGLTLDEQMRLVRTQPALLDIAVTVEANDLATALPVDLSAIRRLSDLAVPFGQPGHWSGRGQAGRARGADAAAADAAPARAWAPAAPRPRPAAGADRDQPASRPDRTGRRQGLDPLRTGTWSDSGRFFNEAAEFFDPIQGGVANCCTIAACRQSPGRCPIGSTTI